MSRDISFYISRLRNTSFSELAYRAKKIVLVKKVERIAKAGKGLVKAPPVRCADIDQLKLPDIKPHDLGGDIVGLLQGNTYTLNADAKALEQHERKLQLHFSSDVSSSDVSRDMSGDIRSAWEPARLQKASALFAYIHGDHFSDADIIKAFVKEVVFRWIENNPFPYGPHYMSAMECGLRTPVFLYCLKQLDDLSSDGYACLLQTIYEHAWWVSKRLSLYSSLGNHTIAESIGLIFGGAIFRKTKEGIKWLEKGVSLLNQELNHQILDDGGPAEQSINYHRFVLDLYWLAVDFLEKNGLYDCTSLKPRLLLGEAFVNALCAGDKAPSIGDSDDGYAIAPGIFPLRGEVRTIQGRIKSFTTSGYTVIKTGDNSCLIFDHGPLGLPPLYNHGHADALSIVLYKDGEEMLVDPGTYLYNGEPEWRRYFKGTRAHNTVCIDGLDQAVQETGFIWSHPYKTELLRHSEQDSLFVIEAQHDGYSRLKKPVRHRRLIVFFDKTNFLIKDTFLGEGIHDFELNFHLHPDAIIAKEHNWWKVQKGNAQIFITLIGESDFKIVCGQDKPLLGWYSPAYGIKRKCNVLSCTKRGHPDEVNFTSAICTDTLIEKNKIEPMILEYE